MGEDPRTISVHGESAFGVYVIEQRASEITRYPYGEQVYEIGSWVPRYVGKGVESRPHRHFIAAANGSKNHLSNVIRKCQRNGIDIRIRFLRFGISERKAFRIEMLRIAKYGRVSDGGPLVNKTLGGEGVSGWIPSDETRKKWSIQRTGKIGPNIGKTLSVETRIKISEAKRGKSVHSKKYRKELSVRMKGNSFATVNKGVYCGEKANSSKLTDAQVQEIRYLCDQACYTRSYIASMYDVGRTAIDKIYHRYSWGHLPYVRPSKKFRRQHARRKSNGG